MTCSHILSLLHVKQIFALHRLLQQGSVLQHQGLDLAQQVAVLFLQVALQLTEQLNSTSSTRSTQIQARSIVLSRQAGKTIQQQGEVVSAACRYLALVCELCGGDVELLELLLEFGEVGVQPGVLQLRLVQLALQLLVVGRQQLVVVEKLTVRLVQPWQR